MPSSGEVHTPRGTNSSRTGKPRCPAVYDNTSAAAAVMGQGKLTSEAGMAAASQAATQSKLRAQQKHQQDLRLAALTAPQHRSQEQVELLCGFLSSTHLLRHLQPTNIKDLAQSITGRHGTEGELIYAQQDPAKNFYIVLSGEAVMYEADGSSAGKQVAQPQITSSSSSSNDHNQQQPAQLGRVLGESSSPSRQGGLQSAAAAAASPSKSCTPRSPRGLRAAATAPTSADSTTPRSTAAAAFGPDQSTLIEVRRVGPREAFGEDDVSSTSCSSRQQTAVACGANSLTWAQLLSHTPLTEPASGGSPGCVGTFSSAPGTTSNSTAAAEAEAATPAVASSAPGGTGGRGFTDGRRRSITRTAANVVVPEGGVVLLQLSADDYGAVLEGRLSVMMEDKVTFLGDLPALRGLNSSYLRSLAHCFHQVHFEPREVVVRQGDMADCMFVLKSGQVCVLIDPNMTLTETAAANTPPAAAGGSSGAVPGDSSDVDIKKLVQVCLLGSGSIIGDMSVREGAGGPPKRSATVVALTELVTYKVPLKEFKRRMPVEVLEAMRQVASQKLVMNERQASSRTAVAASGKEGHILLGGLPVSQGVLRGKDLRSLMESQQTGFGAPVGGLLDALELFFASGNAPGAPSKLSAMRSKKQEVDEYVASLTRNGFIAAPPAEFLALLTDWRSSRSSADRKVPPYRDFPLPIPKRADSPLGSQHSPTASSSSTSTRLPAHSPGESVTAAPGRQGPPRFAAGTSFVAGTNTWGTTQLPATPAIQVHMHMASPGAAGRTAALAGGGPMSTPESTNTGPWRQEQQGEVHKQHTPPADSISTAIEAISSIKPAVAALDLARAGSQPHNLMAGLPISSPRAFRDTLDHIVQQKQQKLLQVSGSPHSNKTRPQSPHAGLQASAVIREATQQLAGASTAAPIGSIGNNTSPFLGPARGGGFKGMLAKAALAPMSSPIGPADLRSAASVPALGTTAPAMLDAQPSKPSGQSALGPPEPTLQDAQVKASSLFRPGSAVAVNSSSKQGHKPGSAVGCSRSRRPGHFTMLTPVDAAAVSSTMAVLEGFGDRLTAAVVINGKGEPELDFHAADYATHASAGKIITPVEQHH